MAAPQVVQGKVMGRPVDIEKARAGGQDLEVMQLSCKDANLPPEIRLGFVKKAYGTLGMMLVITFGISLPFVSADATLSFFRLHTWILCLVMGVSLAQPLLALAMACHVLCCGRSGLLQRCVWMMKTVPWNYMYLATLSVCNGVLVGFVCAQWQAQSVLLVFALTAVLVVALTIYAVRMQADFTGCGAYIMVLILGLVMLILVYSLIPGSLIFSKVIAGVGATLFGFIIVYETQQIFGSASSSLGGGKRNVEYTLDMYAFAAWSLYTDLLSFFVYMLQLFGERR